MKRGILLLSIISLAACSSDSGRAAENNGWQLGDDAGNNASDSGTNNIAANNTVAPTTNNVAPPNNGSTNNGSTNNGSANNTSTGTTSSNNATSSTNNTTPGDGMGVVGDDCTLNSACGANLVCCPGFGGTATCEGRCFGGGLCGGSDAECAADETCCDLSGINQPDGCATRCPGGNGNPGTPCQNNNECQDPEVCCLGFDGSGECTTQCFSGGACAVEADCRNGQLCCDLNFAMVCLDRCSF